uniref:Uncharacterized protein n=1 Tax=Setaria italica TaxID=4555 RepID=K4AK16_SETIT
MVGGCAQPPSLAAAGRRRTLRCYIRCSSVHDLERSTAPRPGSSLPPLRVAKWVVLLADSSINAYQGLLKNEGKESYGVLYKQWQKNAANFSIDEHYPVRELWDRARSCWERIPAHEGKSVLVSEAKGEGRGRGRRPE